MLGPPSWATRRCAWPHHRSGSSARHQILARRGTRQAGRTAAGGSEAGITSYMCIWKTHGESELGRVSPAARRTVGLRRKGFVRPPGYLRVDIGVDVGGTFTDFVGFRGRDVLTTKLLSPPRAASAILRGFRDLHADRMVHGTTVATNAILERRGARTALSTPAGVGGPPATR